MCREGALIINRATRGENVRLVAIAKERQGHKVWKRDFWRAPSELYFDTASEGYPFFMASNGQKQGFIKMMVSYFFGGKIAQGWKRAEKIANNFDGEGLVLGSVMVVSKDGEILFHHKEKEVGDHIDEEEFKAAVKKLGSTGVVACECDDNN